MEVPVLDILDRLSAHDLGGAVVPGPALQEPASVGRELAMPDSEMGEEKPKNLRLYAPSPHASLRLLPIPSVDVLCVDRGGGEQDQDGEDLHGWLVVVNSRLDSSLGGCPARGRPFILLCTLRPPPLISSLAPCKRGHLT